MSRVIFQIYKNYFHYHVRFYLTFNKKCVIPTVMNNNEQLYSNKDEPIKTYNRWPVKHDKIQYGDRLSLLVSFCKGDKAFTENHSNLFLHSKVYYVRAALEAKFNRNFNLAEINRIINDKTWQWRDSSQP